MGNAELAGSVSGKRGREARLRTSCTYGARADIGRSVSSTCGREARRDDQPRLGREERHGAERRMACRDDARTCIKYIVYVVGADVTGDGRVARRNARVDVCGSHGERLGEGRDPSVAST